MKTTKLINLNPKQAVTILHSLYSICQANARSYFGITNANRLLQLSPNVYLSGKQWMLEIDTFVNELGYNWCEELIKSLEYANSANNSVHLKTAKFLREQLNYKKDVLPIA